MSMERTLRTLPDTGLNLKESLLAGTCTNISVPLIESDDTKLIFDSKAYGWRYDGKDHYEDKLCVENPRGEHYVEELRDDFENNNEYTENYQSIGHCPHGLVGDALLIDGVAVELTDVYVVEDEQTCQVRDWKWLLEFKLITH